jgi:hypothetical protein
MNLYHNYHGASLPAGTLYRQQRSRNLVQRRVKAAAWGVETPVKELGHRHHVGGRVACAYVQPATVKAHAPVPLAQVSNIRLRPPPREDIGAAKG